MLPKHPIQVTYSCEKSLRWKTGGQRRWRCSLALGRASVQGRGSGTAVAVLGHASSCGDHRQIRLPGSVHPNGLI